MEQQYFESNYKKLCLQFVHAANFHTVGKPPQDAYIKVLYLPSACRVQVDFKYFVTETPSLFFVNSNQHLSVRGMADELGYLLYYNRDFYCVQIHDHEVACDGLLFNNIFEIPVTLLNENDNTIILGILAHIKEELASQEASREEMIRTYLKQIIIRATRIWKRQQLSQTMEAASQHVEFFRHFSRLVEIHFRSKHSVADYADLLALAPKTLSKKFNQLNLAQPNDIIKDRILLEAKRMLIYSDKSIKEIAYDLGYDDPAYFNRLFTKRTGATPAHFRKEFFGTETLTA